jgi:hypothetical protein
MLQRWNLMASAPIKHRQVVFIGYACAVIALLCLMFVAEWIPNLLPYSPNLALPPSPPAIRSPIFPLVMSTLGMAGLTTWYLLRKLHHYALLSFTLFWVALVGCIAFSYIFLRRTHDVQGLISMSVVALTGVMFWLSLKRNLPM